MVNGKSARQSKELWNIEIRLNRAERGSRPFPIGAHIFIGEAAFPRFSNSFFSDDSLTPPHALRPGHWPIKIDTCPKRGPLAQKKIYLLHAFDGVSYIQTRAPRRHGKTRV